MASIPPVETSFAKERPVSSFFLLAFFLSYIAGIPVIIILQILLPDPFADSVDVILKYGPTFAGIIMAWMVAGKAGLRHLFSALTAFRIHIGWYVFALLLPFILILAGLVAFSQTGGTLQLENWQDASFTALLLLLLTKIFFGGGMGEELGWRGFALPQLQKRMSALKASLIIWIFWTAWHFPAFALAADREGEMPIQMFTIFVFACTILLTWAFNSTGGNLLIPVLFHAAINASVYFLELLVPLSERVAALWWMTGFYCIAAFFILVFYTFENLSGKPKVVWDIPRSGN